MEVSNMKNIVVLKNLPSNIVEEAIIILKTNKEAKRLEYIEKNSKIIVGVIKIVISVILIKTLCV